MNIKDPSASPDLTRAIADFAFGSQGFTHGSRPLAWLTPDELKIDLDDPEQRRFGDYELLERIGQGGMGVVYRARQHGLDRDVAVKLLAAGPWASDEFVARFRREAHNAARMQHPNIVEIYEFGHRDGLNFFSMRLVDGVSLAQRIAGQGPLPEAEAARCARLLAEAMDYAHRLDVLHLDLKPANVLLGRNGELLIADFGLARRVDAGAGGGDEEISGTPSYMAPEQAVQASHPLSASTDIYGLGTILYEMLTGRPPFRGNDVQATLSSVVGEAPAAPRSLRRGLSRDLEAICLRCLEKQPADRFASARELADDLQRFLDGHAVSARPLNWMQRLARWIRREPQLAFAVGVALLALGLGGAATAMSWREARKAQADAEYLGLATLLPGASNESIYQLSEVIRARMVEDSRRALARKLANSSDPHDWLASGLVGHTFWNGEDEVHADAQLARAAAALPSDRLALIAAMRHCRSGWRKEGGSEFEYPGGCPAPDSAVRLARLEPLNLYPWLVQIEKPMLDQWDVGRTVWKYEHDPETHTRIRTLIARAARATYFDSGAYGLMAIKARVYGTDYFPMPRFRWWRESRGETESADSFRNGLGEQWSAAWRTRRTPLGVVSRLCDPTVSKVDPALRADCRRIFDLLVTSKDEVGVNGYGLRGLYHLATDDASRKEIGDRWQQQHWLRDKEAWTRESDPIARGKLYVEDYRRLGEWEADLREADRVGLPRTPENGEYYDPASPFFFY
jgi:hypothetical protein